MVKKLQLIPLFAVICMLVFAGTAFAAVDSAGNDFETGDETPLTGTYEHDLIWAGDTAAIQSAEVGGDILVAGQSVDVTDSTAKGNIRAAGQSISLIGVKANGNATIAGQRISVDKASTMNGAYLAAQEVFFDGTASALSAFAETVTIDGTINGDAHVVAKEVHVAADTVVTGTLVISSSEEPDIADGAQIANTEISEIDTGGAEEATAGLAAGGAIALLVIGLFGMLILALLLMLFFPIGIERFARLTVTRTAAVIIGGLLTAILMPVIVILLLVFVVTIPVALILLLGMLAVTLAAPAITGVSLGRVFFKNMNRWGAGVLTTLIIIVLTHIPIIGWIIRLCCIVYALGVVLFSILSKRKAHEDAVDGEFYAREAENAANFGTPSALPEDPRSTYTDPDIKD